MNWKPTKWKPGDLAIIMPSVTPCEVDSIINEYLIGVFVPKRDLVFSWRAVSPLQLVAPGKEG